MVKKLRDLYEFGPFRLDADERLLLRDGQVIPLAPKAFDVLMALLEHPGRLLEKETLLKMVWPDSFVEEGNLADAATGTLTPTLRSRSGLRRAPE